MLMTALASRSHTSVFHDTLLCRFAAWPASKCLPPAQVPAPAHPGRVCASDSQLPLDPAKCQNPTLDEEEEENGDVDDDAVAASAVTEAALMAALLAANSCCGTSVLASSVS